MVKVIKYTNKQYIIKTNINKIYKQTTEKETGSY